MNFAIHVQGVFFIVYTTIKLDVLAESSGLNYRIEVLKKYNAAVHRKNKRTYCIPFRMRKDMSRLAMFASTYTPIAAVTILILH